MSVPSKKNPAVERMLTNLFGVNREESVLNGLCVEAPTGCGKPVEGFTTDLNAREYRISGLCEKCQERYF